MKMARWRILAKNMEKFLNNKELRKKIKSIRDNISLEQRESMSQDITENVLALLESDFKGANIFLCFYPFGSEVDLRGLYNTLKSKGKRIFFPVSDSDRHELSFHEVNDFSKDFSTGAYGIMEPCKDLPLLEEVHDEVVVITPGVSFDNSCNRIGYGGGYYDRFFEQHSNYIKIGVGFEQQMVDNLKIEAHDMPLDYIVTNDRLIKRGA